MARGFRQCYYELKELPRPKGAHYAENTSGVDAPILCLHLAKGLHPYHRKIELQTRRRHNLPNLVERSDLTLDLSP